MAFSCLLPCRHWHLNERFSILTHAIMVDECECSNGTRVCYVRDLYRLADHDVFFLLPLRDAVCRSTAISYSVTIIPFLGPWLGFRDVISLADLPPVAMAGAVYFGMIYLAGKMFARVGAAHYRRVVQWVLVTLSASVLI
jgi:hypothetical protein